MVRSLSNFFTGIMQRWMPDAFIFAIVLTLVVMVAGVFGGDNSPTQMVRFWGGGIWNLLAFSMQVVLTLVTGSILAQTDFVKNILRNLARVASTPTQAIVLMTVIAAVCFWISWGFGLIGSALMAREIARQVRGVHYPLLVASAYSGFVVWHAGLSGSIPLKIAVDEGGAISALMNGSFIPISETIFSWPVIAICLMIVVTMPLINCLMMPAAADVIEFAPSDDDSSLLDNFEPNTPAEKIEHSRVPTFILGSLGAFYLIDMLANGGGFGLNAINFSFLVMGLLLHRSPAAYLIALNRAIQDVSGIVLQFPLYAGIMGMMVQSGLAVSISSWFVAISTEGTFTLFTFLSAGVVNFFVPSGGGQWAVQAPIVIPAAQALGVPIKNAAMAVAFGDAWTNLVQPLWALPMLGVAGLSLKDIMGYCTVMLLWSGCVFAVGIYFLL